MMTVHPTFPRSRTPLRLTALLLPALLAGCSGRPAPATPAVTPPPSAPGVRGAVELTFELGAHPSAQATVRAAGLRPQDLRLDGDVTFERPAAFTDYDDTTGFRYMNATFTVRNVSAQALENLTLYAYTRASTNVGGTALKNITNAAGQSLADASVARSVLPMHGTAFDALSGTSAVVPTQADFQVFTAAEASALETAARSANVIAAEDQVLQYGYSARNLNTSGNRRRLEAAGCGAPGCDTGRVTIAVRVPNTNVASNPYRFTMTFVLADEAVTRVSQGVQEQGDDSLVRARAADVGASEVRVLGDSSYDGAATPVCAPRIAVPAGSDGALALGGDCPTTAGVLAAAETGRVIISEFQALGSEFVEVRNVSGAAIDLRNFWLRNAAGQLARLRAPTDLDGRSGTPALLAAGASAYGVANPAGGALPAGVNFVYGAPGTPFTLSDSGDLLALMTRVGGAATLEDRVDFRTFVTNPNTPLTASSMVGFAGVSTQLDSAAGTAAANNTPTNWCGSLYLSSGRGNRVTNTAGSANSSCQVAAINEVLIDAPAADDGKTFVELVGPGGALIGGARVNDVEGMGTTAGTLNVDNDLAPGETDGTFVIPAGTRFPADGILLIADATTAGATSVPGYVAGVDVLARDMDMENGGGDAIQLVSAGGSLLDTVSHDPTGNPLATNAAFNGLALYESATALTPIPPTTTAATLARAALGADTNNNRIDFYADPSPTPGDANDAVNFTAGTLSPDDGPATLGAANITVTGTDFSPGLRLTAGSAASSACTVLSATAATCTVPANVGGATGPVNVRLQNPASVAAPDAVLAQAFTYTAAENETNSAAEADFCTLQFPATFSVTQGQRTPNLYGQVYEAGLTEAAGAPANLLAEVGYGPSASSPLSSNAWRFFPATYNVQVGNNDEFVGTFTAPVVTASATYAYTFRFSQDGGVRWTYCDVNGAGSGAGLTFESTQLGSMTVAP